MILWAIGLLIVFALGVVAYACGAPTAQIFHPVLVRGSEGSCAVVLTFDDGPAPPFTDQILDILRERKISATFFLCGKNVERYPEIARRIVREGHAIGNHTYSHPLLMMRSRKFIAEEIDRAQGVIEMITGVRPTLFRPPYGARWFGLMRILGERNLKMVMWSAAGRDWKYGTQPIIRTVAQEMQPGAVILLHDGHERLPPEKIDQSCTVQALPAIIDLATRAGLSCVPIERFAV